jgi:hypothetical protein
VAAEWRGGPSFLVASSVPRFAMSAATARARRAIGRACNDAARHGESPERRKMCFVRVQGHQKREFSLCA